MKTNDLHKYRKTIAVTAACLSIGWLCWSGASLGHAQNAPANLSPGLQEVLKLTQNHLPDEIVTAYVKNSGQSYSLTADDILYLNSQGVSQSVLSALLQSRSAAPAMPATPAPPPMAYPVPSTPAPPATPVMPPPVGSYVPPVPPPGSAISLPYFETQLQPYGGWVDVPPYGPAWRPNESVNNPLWRPYFDKGSWQYTDAGWYWNSEAPYGDIVFHYGRWLKDFRYGWVWVPGYDWAPAWVAWRQAEGYAGWAPLPPLAYYEAGVGLMYRGRLALDVDFGLDADAFVFIGYDHFWDHDYRGFLAPRDRLGLLFRSSAVLNGYRVVDGRFVVEGLGRDRIAALTHRKVRPGAIVIRDARIGQAREFDRSHAIQHVQEVRGRPANDPARSALEGRDREEPRNAGGNRGDR
jgi:hypothetical protein